MEDEEGDFIDTEERVREVVATATLTVTDVDIIEDRQLDSDEQDAVCSFVRQPAAATREASLDLALRNSRRTTSCLCGHPLLNWHVMS